MQHQVPQFIETESKIVGPFTFKQFIYILAGAIFLFIIQNFVSVGTLIVVAIPVAGVSFGLAFLRIDGIPLPRYIVMAISFGLDGKQYLFGKDGQVQDVKELITKDPNTK